MLKPLKDRVVIQMVEQEEKTAGGLFLPTTAQEKLQFAKVIATSEFTATEDRQVAVGDKVVSRNIQEQKLNQMVKNISS